MEGDGMNEARIIGLPGDYFSVSPTPRGERTSRLVIVNLWASYIITILTNAIIFGL